LKFIESFIKFSEKSSKVQNKKQNCKINLIVLFLHHSMLNNLNVILFLKLVTAEKAIAKEKAVNLLEIITDEYNFNF